jgi:hypothetical protein
MTPNQGCGWCTESGIGHHGGINQTGVKQFAGYGYGSCAGSVGDYCCGSGTGSGHMHGGGFGSGSGSLEGGLDGSLRQQNCGIIGEVIFKIEGCYVSKSTLLYDEEYWFTREEAEAELAIRLLGESQ